MNRTGISWTGETWNVIRGCRKYSKGCEHCYAMETANRVNKAHSKLGHAEPYGGLVQIRRGRPVWTGDVLFVVRLLVAPLRKKQPLTIFVNSMSDLFYEVVTFEQIAAVFGVMAAANWHTFQVLTKRAERLVEWFSWVSRTAAEHDMTPAQLCMTYARELATDDASCMKVLNRPEVIAMANAAAWPLPNVWIGVSAEDLDNADARVPLLVQVPAAVRFVSAEPLLGPVDLTPWMNDLGWVIAGCESGDDRRPADIAWFRSLRDQCTAAGTAYFLKQVVAGPGITLGSIGKRKKKGIVETPALDGEAWAAFPSATGVTR